MSKKYIKHKNVAENSPRLLYMNNILEFSTFKLKTKNKNLSI